MVVTITQGVPNELGFLGYMYMIVISIDKIQLEFRDSSAWITCVGRCDVEAWAAGWDC